MPRCLARYDRRAFTLTELAIVLGVIGVILGAVWSGAATVFQRQRVNDQVAQVKALADNMRGMYAAAKTMPFSNGQDITTAMVSAGVVPAYMMVPGNAYPQDIEGSNINIYYIANNYITGAGGGYFQFNLGGVPKTCNSVLSYFSGLATDLGITAVYADAGPAANSWQNPTTNGLDSSSFGACDFMAFQFSLHN